ncbi:hypothetical protein ASD53_15220 [Lysobacter sp. Root559]|nr:hypothetical protein ASD53_15220 [Lysobacter sp. Root559]KRC31557.1 hypothetical protein ASE10_17705 [Lysobacter sp. Root76]KRD65464.1 hypothetical protein ASE45_18900 [Lysobacter sp. Root96]
MSAAAPCRCGCARADGAAAHAIVAALAADDLDRALALGLLDAAACSACTPDCTAMLIDARVARSKALAARARYRARNARLAQRAQERAAQRAGARAPEAATRDGAMTPAAEPSRPTLPSAAAAALARAKAKAAERNKS